MSAETLSVEHLQTVVTETVNTYVYVYMLKCLHLHIYKIENHSVQIAALPIANNPNTIVIVSFISHDTPMKRS